ncbi:MAG: phytoene desaturase, partial [Bacteroidales bacterium]|nr:phytoene desaturase [Bacteroidales bacterium]
ERKLGEPAGNTLAYLKDCRQLFELTRPVFLEQEISIRKALSKSYLSAYPRLHRLKAWTSLHRHHARVFRTPEAIQLFDRYATYNGSNPYSAPATLRVIAHLEHNEGAYFPLEGMYGLAKGMHKLALELGVEFRFNSTAEKLIVQNGRITGAETSTGYVAADFVFSSADVSSPHGFSRRPPLPPSQLSTSAIIFYLGMLGEYPGLGLHNIFFSSDYRSEFRHLFDKGELSDDLSVYVFISSKMVPTDAPDGCENWFVMVNAPVDRGQDWENIAVRARASVLTKLEQELGLPIAGNILSESHLLPPDLARNTNAWKGALYGPHSNHTMSAFRRHPVQGRYPNLFHTGGSVHPGGGIPLCLLSARIATEKIFEQ